MIPQEIKILETPRDAMQGIDKTIPTPDKVALLSAALQVGFDVVDIGSFVSPKVIQQFTDMHEVLIQLEDIETKTSVFVLTGNEKGAESGSEYELIDYIGFPFSLSEAFLRRNIRSTIAEAWQTIQQIQNICLRSGKKQWVYFTMAFGNPYGDPVDEEALLEWTDRLYRAGIKQISLSDIIGVATPGQVGRFYELLTSRFPDIEFGLHLHIAPQEDWYAKVKAAYSNGCKVFDGVTGGFGGCPMTGYEMLSNLPTRNLLQFINREQLTNSIRPEAFEKLETLSLTTLSRFR